MKTNSTPEEQEFLLRSIIHFGAGIYLLGMGVFLFYVMYNGSVTYTLNGETIIDFAIVIPTGIILIILMMIDTKRILRLKKK